MQAVLLDKATFSPLLKWTKVLDQVDELLTYQTTTSEQLISHVGDAKIVITNKVVLGAAELGRLSQVKLICIAATGMNNIDLVAAQELGIKVTNVEDYSTLSVAQQVMSFILNFATQQSSYVRDVKGGGVARKPCVLFTKLSYTFCGRKSLGIIGYGEIGRAVEKLAQAFGMKIYIAQSLRDNKIEQGRVSLEDCLAQSDFVTLHCPLTSQTKQLMNIQRLALMRPNSYLINTARGGLIDETALAHALQSGKIAGAGLDVLTQEPPEKNNILLSLNHPQLMITPHIAWASIESQQCLVGKIAERIANWNNSNF